MPVPYLLVLALLIGFAAGLRAMLPIAIVAWGQKLGVLNYVHWMTAWIATTPAVVVFTLAAIGELVADKLPKTPSRLETGSLVVRSLSGLLCGVALALTAGIHIAYGGLAGLVGALLGSYAGYNVRRALTVRNRKRDLPVALAEDALAFLIALFCVSRF